MMHSFRYLALIASLAAISASAASVTISQIQGDGHFSPYDGEKVRDVQGVVTSVTAKGFYMQSVTPDGNPATSEGILVMAQQPSLPRGGSGNHQNNADLMKRKGKGGHGKPPPPKTPPVIFPGVSVGELVTVDGTVGEWSYKKKTSGINTQGFFIPEQELPVTQIEAVTDVRVLGSGRTVEPFILKMGILPKELIYVPAPLRYPHSPIKSKFSDWSSSTLDYEKKSLDLMESLEGMLVRIPNPIAVSRGPKFFVLPEQGDGATGFDRKHNVITVSGDGETMDDMNPEKFLVLQSGDSWMDANVMPGDVFDYIEGVVVYTRGLYGIFPTRVPVKTVPAPAYKLPVAAPAPKDELSVASYNVENLSGISKQDKFDRIAKQIIVNLASPDILMISEIQDNDGPTSGSTATGCQVTVDRLNSAFVEAGGQPYKAAFIDPQHNQDGGQPNGNIRIGFLYNPNRVRLSSSIKGAGGALDEVEVVQQDKLGPVLNFNPGRISPTDPAFIRTRKALVASFEFRDQRLFFVGNHFSSKIGSSSLYGAIQQPINKGDTKRSEQAEVVRKWLTKLTKIDADAKIIASGDYNDFDFAEPIRVLRGTSPRASPGPTLYNMADTLPLSERWTYIFDGNAQALDHVLVSQNLHDVGAFTPMHLNTLVPQKDEASDHDPVVCSNIDPRDTL